MSTNRTRNYAYLNREGEWRGFASAGLAIDQNGVARLETLPRADTMPEWASSLPAPDGPAGVAAAPDGSIYFTDPKHNRVLRLDGCDGRVNPAACISDESAGEWLKQPRGLMFDARRRALLIADSGNNRVLIVQVDPVQLLGVWRELNGPCALAADSEANVYAVDRGDRLIRKFDASGQVQTAFADRVREQIEFSDPVGIAAWGAVVFVLDSGPGRVVTLSATGDLLGSFSLPGEPLALAADSRSVYVGDNSQRRIYRYLHDGTLVGEASGFEAPVAALALARHHGEHGLYVHPGGSAGILRLSPNGSYARRGVLWSIEPALSGSARSEQAHLLRATAEIPHEGHIRIAYALSQSDTPPNVDVDAAQPLGKEWVSLPLDAPATLIEGGPSDRLWVAAEFSGEGNTTPSLSQIRVDFDHQTYLSYLPEVYRDDAKSARFFARYLSAFETVFSTAETLISRLGRLFDPHSAPQEFVSWLAGWLAIEADDNLSEDLQREIIASAFELYGKRGTVEGLRAAIRLFTGLEVRILEPILAASWWSLSDDDSPAQFRQTSILGVTTMLAAADAQGAVLDTSAVLDGSHLIDGDEFGAPLFEDVAYRFLVLVYRGQSYSEKKLDQLRRVLDREKPAHTLYSLCTVEPQMRIGGVRVGIDTLVAGVTVSAERENTLSGELVGRIGSASRIGSTTRLGGQAVRG